MYLFINGEIVKKEQARISPFDHGFLYGVGLFETFRIYDGHPFLLDDHLVRLDSGLQDLRIEYLVKRKEIVEIIDGLLQANGCKDAYVRLNVSAGEGEVGLPANDYIKPSVIVFMKEAPTPPQEKHAVIIKTSRNTPEGNNRLKSHHFLNNIYGKREVGNNPSVEGIFKTKEGYLAEGITSNLFWIKGDKLFTPALQTGILNGVTRAFVIKVSEILGLEVEEGFYLEKELLSSDEAFITNSIQEIVALDQVEDVVLPGRNGPLTKQLQSIYLKYRTSLWSRNELTKGIV